MAELKVKILLKHVSLKKTFFKEAKKQEIEIKKVRKCYNEKRMKEAVGAGISIITAYR